MSSFTLKSLHNYLKLLENASELKRRLPASASLRTLNDGLTEISRLVDVDEAIFKDAEQIAALIGGQRFVMIGGEPSITDQVARVFDNTRVLLTGLVSGGSLETTPVGQVAAAPQQGGAMAALTLGYTAPKSDSPAGSAMPKAEREVLLNDLRSLLSGNPTLTGRLYRALFEHMLGFALQTGAPQGTAALVNELTGSKEHGRSFLATALFILGMEVDREHLMAYMVQQGLFGIPVFEHLLQNRDYCGAFHSFRHLERVFIGSPAAEETHLRNRLDTFNAQFGGKPYAAKIFAADEKEKAKIDAYLAAADLLEALAITPWCIGLSNAVSVASSNSVRCVSIIAAHFERFGRGDLTKDRANQEIADHLLAFARQFSADSKPA